MIQLSITDGEMAQGRQSACIHSNLHAMAVPYHFAQISGLALSTTGGGSIPSLFISL